MEIFTLVTGVIYIILEIRQKNFMWVVGILTSVAAMWVFFRQGLYASFGLNTYYLVTSVIGLWQWRRDIENVSHLYREKYTRLVRLLREKLPEAVSIFIMPPSFEELEAARWLSYLKKGGKIITVASMLSYQGGIRVPAYTASKHAVMGVTKSMANEWAKYGINVNAIAPGYMATNNTAALRADANRSEAILDRIPAGRWGTPDDIVGAGIFLASSASDYVHGFTIAVDGGWLGR